MAQQHIVPREDRDHIIAIIRDRNGMDLRLLEIAHELMRLKAQENALVSERIELTEKRKQIINVRIAEKFGLASTTVGYIAEGRTS